MTRRRDLTEERPPVVPAAEGAEGWLLPGVEQAWRALKIRLGAPQRRRRLVQRRWRYSAPEGAPVRPERGRVPRPPPEPRPAWNDPSFERRVMLGALVEVSVVTGALEPADAYLRGRGTAVTVALPRLRPVPGDVALRLRRPLPMQRNGLWRLLVLLYTGGRLARAARRDGWLLHLRPEEVAVLEIPEGEVWPGGAGPSER